MSKTDGHAETITDTAVNQPLSPGQLAWRRLKRNKLAMIGLLLVIVFHVLCFFAPLFTSQSPSRLRTWVGSLPPGSSSIACHEENVLETGTIADFNRDLSSASQLTLDCSELSSVDYRITVYRSGSRAGTIKQIQQKTGAINLETLDLSTGRLIDLDHPKTQLPHCVLKLREAAPADLLINDEQYVLQIRHVDPARSKHFTVEAQLENGLVTALQRDGQAVEQLRINGENINSILIDGEAALHYHLLGTDTEGRDLWSRILYGGRISLLVGIVATVVSLVIGVFYGALSGYKGGRTDRFMMSAVDVLYAIPFMFVVILLLVTFGKNILILFAALGAVQWLTTARIVRGQVLSLKNREFIEAARVNGASTWTIITRHLLPNALGPIIVYATLTVPAVILEESFLAFLGLQVEWGDQPLDSWGYLVNDGRLAMNFQTWDQWWLLIWPALAMVLTLFGLNTLGDGLRDALDPQDHGHD